MIGFDVKKLFFDRKAVTSRLDRATRRVFTKFGSFVRQTAKRSIRSRKSPSPPGSPPSSHTGLLKRFIFFGYEPARRTVVIGPVQLRRAGGEAPHLLEHGGTTRIRRRGKRRAARYPARPFMGPAFEKEQAKLPEIWRQSVK